MNTKIAYSYYKKYNEYAEPTVSYEDPMVPGRFPLPAKSTFKVPLTPTVNNAVVFNETTDEWIYVVDNRGKQIYLKTNSKSSTVTSDDLYAEIPEEYTLVAPPDNENMYVFVDNAWVYTITKDELHEYIYQLKADTAYTGIYIIRDSNKYLFETSQDSITLCNSTLLALSTMPDETTVSWKVWLGDTPTTMVLTKVQLQRIFAFGMTMISNTFAVEGELNNQIETFTEEQLTDKNYINTFKETAKQKFDAVPKTYDFDTLEK